MAAPSSTRFGHPFTFLQLPFPSSLIKIHQFVIPRPLHGYAAAIQIPELLKVEVGGGGGEGEQKRGRPGSVQHPGVRRWDEPGYCSVAASRGAAGAVIVAAHEEIFGGENILHGVLPAPGELRRDGRKERCKEGLRAPTATRHRGDGRGVGAERS